MEYPLNNGSEESSGAVREDGFELAFEKYWKQLYHHAMRKVDNQELSEDLVQETFVVLWNNIEILARPDQVQAYLYGVLRNKILDVYRKDEVRLRYADSLSRSTEAYGESADQRVLSRELEELISDELSRMPGRMVEIFRLKRHGKLSNAQIAAQLGLSEQTVKNQNYRAAERLKKRIVAYDSSLLISALSLLMHLRH